MSLNLPYLDNVVERIVRWVLHGWLLRHILAEDEPYWIGERYVDLIEAARCVDELPLKRGQQKRRDKLKLQIRLRQAMDEGLRHIA